MIHSSRRALAVLVLGLAGTGALSPAAASAQEAIVTAPRSAQSAPPTVAPSDTLKLSDHVDYGPGFLGPVGPCGGPAKTAEGKTDKTPHGEVWAGVGTHGYREAGGVVCMPLSDKSAVTIAVDAGRMDGWRRR